MIIEYTDQFKPEAKWFKWMHRLKHVKIKFAYWSTLAFWPSSFTMFHLHLHVIVLYVIIIRMPIGFPVEILINLVFGNYHWVQLEYYFNIIIVIFLLPFINDPFLLVRWYFLRREKWTVNWAMMATLLNFVYRKFCLFWVLNTSESWSRSETWTYICWIFLPLEWIRYWEWKIL